MQTEADVARGQDEVVMLDDDVLGEAAAVLLRLHVAARILVGQPQVELERPLHVVHAAGRLALRVQLAAELPVGRDLGDHLTRVAADAHCGRDRRRW